MMLKSIQSLKTSPAQRLSRRSMIETQDGTTLFFSELGWRETCRLSPQLGIRQMWEYQMNALSSPDSAALHITNVGVVAPANQVMATIIQGE